MSKHILVLIGSVLLLLASCPTSTVVLDSSITLAERYQTAYDGHEKGGWGTVAYPLPPVDGIMVHRTRLDYGTTLDIYMPETDGEPLPVVILPRIYSRQNDLDWVGVSLLDIDYQVSWCHLLAAEGYAVVGMESDSPFNGLVALVDFLRENSKALGVDTDRMAFWAVSSNPDVVLMYLARPDLDKNGFLAGGFLYPALDGVPFSKVEHIPYFIASGGRDDPALNAAASRFMEKADEAGLEYVYMFHPEGQHGFDSLQHDETTGAIIAALLEFYRTKLK